MHFILFTRIWNVSISSQTNWSWCLNRIEVLINSGVHCTFFSLFLISHVRQCFGRLSREPFPSNLLCSPNRWLTLRLVWPMYKAPQDDGKLSTTPKAHGTKGAVYLMRHVFFFLFFSHFLFPNAHLRTDCSQLQRSRKNYLDVVSPCHIFSPCAISWMYGITDNFRWSIRRRFGLVPALTHFNNLLQACTITCYG